jgi:hypothetical protein
MEILAVIGLVISMFVYFVPAGVAHQRKKKQLMAILLLNIFGGWTVVGWVGARWA